MKASRHAQVAKGISYDFEDRSTRFADKLFGVQRTNGYETTLLKGLKETKEQLLRSIEAWDDCPQSYRTKLCKKLQLIDISKKTAGPKLDVIKGEIGILEFNLQLNPSWIRGLLKSMDEILDQTKQEQRDQLITGFAHLKEQIALLKNACSRYQAVK